MTPTLRRGGGSPIRWSAGRRWVRAVAGAGCCSVASRVVLDARRGSPAGRSTASPSSRRARLLERRRAGAPAASAHPNGAVGIDHVVGHHAGLRRDGLALELRRAGAAARPRRRRVPAGVPPARRPRSSNSSRPRQMRPGPARFWGLVVIVSDLDALAERLGRAPRLGLMPRRGPAGTRWIATLRDRRLGPRAKRSRSCDPEPKRHSWRSLRWLVSAARRLQPPHPRLVPRARSPSRRRRRRRRGRRSPPASTC